MRKNQDKKHNKDKKNPQKKTRYKYESKQPIIKVRKKTFNLLKKKLDEGDS